MREMPECFLTIGIDFWGQVGKPRDLKLEAVRRPIWAALCRQHV